MDELPARRREREFLGGLVAFALEAGVVVAIGLVSVLVAVILLFLV